MTIAQSAPAHLPEEAASAADRNPFDAVEFLPGLGIAVLWVVLSYVFVSLLLMPVHGV